MQGPRGPVFVITFAQPHGRHTTSALLLCSKFVHFRVSRLYSHHSQPPKDPARLCCHSSTPTRLRRHCRRRLSHCPPRLQHTKYTSNMLVVTSASASQAQTVKTRPFVTTTTLPTLPSSMPPRHANTHLSLLPITCLHQRNWPCPSPHVSLFPAPFYASCRISLTLGPCLVSQQQ